MVAIPKLSFLYSTLLYPVSSKICFIFSPKGKAFTESGKYVYALLSLETNLPICGKIFLK